MRRKRIIILFIILVICFSFIFVLRNLKKESSSIKFDKNITITVNNKKLKVTLAENVVSKKIFSIIPFTSTFSDLNKEGKYIYLDDSIENAKYEELTYIDKGDILVSEDNRLIIAYKNFVSEDKYVKIGTIKDTSNLESILGKNNVIISFED